MFIAFAKPHVQSSDWLADV